MSQADFARAVGETPQTVQNWKTRGAIPGNKLPTVARVLNTSVDWLLTGTEKVALAIKEEQTPYGAVPTQLIEAWQHLDDATRTCVLNLVQQLARSTRAK